MSYEEYIKLKVCYDFDTEHGSEYVTGTTLFYINSEPKEESIIGFENRNVLGGLVKLETINQHNEITNNRTTTTNRMRYSEIHTGIQL